MEPAGGSSGSDPEGFYSLSSLGGDQKIVDAVVQRVTDTVLQRLEDAKVAKDIASQIEVDSFLAHLEGGRGRYHTSRLDWKQRPVHPPRTLKLARAAMPDRWWRSPCSRAA